MKGSEFLDKLEHLDQDLILEADREPVPRSPRRVDFGVCLAVAACLCVLCLPMILSHVFGVQVSTAEAGSAPAAGAEASHQAPEETPLEQGAGVEDGQETVDGTEKKSGDSPSYSMIEGQAEMGLEDGSVIPYVEITEEFILENYPKGLPADEYFAHNAQSHQDHLLWDGCDYDQGEVSFHVAWVEEYLPRLPHYGIYDIRTDYDEADNLTRLQIHWSRDDTVYYPSPGKAEGVMEDILDNTEYYIALNISKEDVVSDPDRLLQAKIARKMTLVNRDGVQITALGGKETDKLLTFQKDGFYYRIYGGNGATAQEMLDVLDSVLKDGGYPLERFTKDQGTIYKTVELEDYPDAFRGYYPTNSRWVIQTDDALVDLKDGEPYALHLQYNYTDSPMLTNWSIQVEEALGDDPVKLKEEGIILGELSALTKDQLKTGMQTAEDFYIAQTGAAPTVDDFVNLGFMFHWDKYYVSCYYKPGTDLDQLWNLLYTLQNESSFAKRLEAMDP